MKFESSVIIDRPISQVFEFVSDPENDTKWRRGHTRAKRLTPLPAVAGTRCDETVKAMGMEKDLTIEFTEVVPNKRIAFRATRFGPMEPHGTFGFEVAAGGTRMTFTAEPKVSGFFRLMTPFMARMGKSDLQQSLAALKAHLESAIK